MTGGGPATRTDGGSVLLRPKENALPAALKDREFDPGSGGIDTL